MIMQKMRRAEHVPPESKAGFYPVVRSHPGRGAMAWSWFQQELRFSVSLRKRPGERLRARLIPWPAGTAMAKDDAVIKNLIHCILPR
jgi:hypothetical protein